jgi:hypothetical protein
MERQCQEWAEDLRRKGTIVRLPAGSEYEVRRSLIRSNLGAALAQLDMLVQRYGRLSVTDDDWMCARELWANARLMGFQPTDNKRLDFDTLLAAQAAVLDRRGEDVWIATDNIGDLGALYHKAQLWDEITP